MFVERSAVTPRGVRIAVHHHMRLQVELHQIGHGERGRGWCRHRFLAALDAIDDGDHLFARMLGGEFPMPTDGNAL